MKQIDALATLLGMNASVFTTADAAALLKMPRSHASQTLRRLAAAGHLVRLARGRWGAPGKLEPFALPEYLTAPLPAYVSLYSAMFHHGMIEQIPTAVYAITLARARRCATPLAVVDLRHVSPSFFFGYETHGRRGVKIAVPEKALLDALYLAAGRSRGFGSFPEIELPRNFSVRTARSLLARIPSPSLRRRVASKLEAVLAEARVQRGKT